MSFRSLPKITLPDPPKPIVGEVGALRMLPLSALVVDPVYQRDIGARGVKKILEIARRFSWIKFTPVICAEIGEGKCRGKFAIIDGQHRCAAAVSRGGIEDVPCWVIAADVTAQADTFVAINIEKLGVYSGQIWHARKAAGDPDAVHLFQILDKAGVTLSRSPLNIHALASDVTACAGNISQSLRCYGDAITLRALNILREAGERKDRGIMYQCYVLALPSILFEADGNYDRKLVDFLAKADDLILKSEAYGRHCDTNGPSTITALIDLICERAGIRRHEDMEAA